MDLNYFDIVTRAKKRYSAMLEPVCKKYDLTRNELDVLLFLANNPGYDRAADIVARRGISKSHVSMAVTNLELRGLLRCRRENSDRRALHLELIPEAGPIIREGKRIQQAYYEVLFHGISTQEHDLMRRINEIVSKNIESMEE